MKIGMNKFIERKQKIILKAHNKITVRSKNSWEQNKIQNKKKYFEQNQE